MATEKRDWAKHNASRRKLPIRPCLGCGNEISRSDSIRCKACGRAHRSALARRRRIKAKLAKAAAGTRGRSVFTAGYCSVDACGISYVTWGESHHCSKACRAGRKTVGSTIRRRQREAGYTLTQRRRLMVHERDDWICQICYDPVNREAKAPAPDSPVIDHIVPLAAGGAHHESNWQTAHFYCNCVKRDQVDFSLVA